MPQTPSDPVSALKTALSLRAGSLAAFPVGAVVMAILERGWLSIGALTLAMLAVSLFERRRIGRALGIAIPANTASVVTGLAVRFGLLTGLFVVTVGVLALFRDTALSRQLGLLDLAVIAVTSAAALVANALSARMAPLPNVQAQPPRRHAPPEGVILEGEIIDPDTPR